MEHIDCVVVGAGVVGLAVARSIARSGREVLVLEECPAIGTQTSARNSEVIHAGIYYAPESLKARLCVRGKNLLYDYCGLRGVAHRRCGKLIVATSEADLAELANIRDRAAANGVSDLEVLTAAQAQNMEPALQCVAALHSPSTGMVDSHALMLALLGDLENAGGTLALNTCLSSGEVKRGGMHLETADGTRLRTRFCINAAGLGAPNLALHITGLDGRHVPVAHFAKGNYFSLAGRSPFSRLIYPVPDVDGLGVHLTLDLAGQVRFGPDVQWVESADDFSVNPERADAFYGEIRKYWPALPDGSLVPAYAGIRPKIHGPLGVATDFYIQEPKDHAVEGLVNLFGIESPGLTAALAIGEYVAAIVNA